MTAYRSDAELIAGVRKWQRILHIEDWEIRASLVPQTFFGDRTTSAHAEVASNFHRASIKLATFETLDLTVNPEDADQERTLVHELVHLVFRPVDMFNDEKPGSATMRLYERAVESMARTLVELDRRAA